MKFLTKKIKLTAAVLLTVVLISFLLTQVSIPEIISTLRNLNLFWVFIGFIGYGFSYLFRAVRFKVLMKDELSVSEFFKVVSIHNMWNNLLPLRTGEFAYLFLLGKRGFSKTRALASLMTARIMDLFVIIFVFFVAYFMAGTLSTLVKGFVSVFLFIAVLLVILQGGLLFYGNKFLHAIKQFLALIRLDDKKFSKFFLKKLKVLLKSFKSMHKQHIPAVIILSILIWLSQYFMATSLILAMNLPLSYAKIVIGITFVLLVAALPIHGVGSFGTLEGAWGIVFSALGLTVATAVSSAFAYHIVLYVFFLTFGISAWVLELKTTKFKTQ